ncbi:MAG: polyprenyl synthetase family protein [Planctomycetota bacterium]
MRAEQTPATLRLAELYSPIAIDLERSRSIFNEELASDQDFIADLCGHVAQFHGKLLRPAILLLSGRASGQLTAAHPILAAVVEMVHIATLVHDDVLDEADVRRRAATVNRLWGNERAVLMGDFLISHAFHLCSGVDSGEASRIVGATTNTVCEGEMMQIANRDNLELGAEEYLDIIARKTAALIGTCCLLGARYAGADEQQAEHLKSFGRALGIAFQIVDDVLDLVGDEAEAGKSLGRDADLGKLTLPMIHHLQNASAQERHQLRDLLTSDISGRRRQIAALLETNSSITHARRIARNYVDEARDSLDALPPSPARDSLCAMAEFVLARTL